jgi:hypothetical protein
MEVKVMPGRPEVTVEGLSDLDAVLSKMYGAIKNIQDEYGIYVDGQEVAPTSLLSGAAGSVKDVLDRHPISEDSKEFKDLPGSGEDYTGRYCQKCEWPYPCAPALIVYKFLNDTGWLATVEDDSEKAN